MADGEARDTDATAPDNGVRIKARRGNKPSATPAQDEKRSKPAPTPAESLERPDVAVDHARVKRAKVLQGLREDDARRMASVRVLTGEIRSGLESLLSTLLPALVPGITADETAAVIASVMAERTVAGLRVRDGKGGPLLTQRKLSRPQAMAYALGGEVQDAYVMLASLQVAHPVWFAVTMLAVHTAGVARATRNGAERAAKRVADDAARASAETASNDNGGAS